MTDRARQDVAREIRGRDRRVDLVEPLVARRVGRAIEECAEEPGKGLLIEPQNQLGLGDEDQAVHEGSAPHESPGPFGARFLGKVRDAADSTGSPGRRNDPEQAFTYCAARMRPQDLACIGVFTGDDSRMLETDVRLFETHVAVQAGADRQWTAGD